MTRVGGGTFSLISLDAGEFHNPPAPDRPDAEMLIITGHQLGGGVVTHTLNIDGLRDGLGGIPDYEHFVLPNTFVNLTSVTFTGLRSDNSDGGIAIDNLEYDAGAPEVLPGCVATPLVPEVPTLTITNPVPGYVAGTVMVEATPSAALASVRFLVDGVALGAPVTVAPYRIAWDTTLVADGPHAITAEGRDAADNLITASVTVTVRNTPTSNQAHYLELDGVDDYLQIPDAPALSFGIGTVDTPLTIEMWLRPDLMGRHQILGKWGETGTNLEYRLHIVSGWLRLELRDNSAQSSAAAFTVNNFAGLVGSWHHLAVTYDGRGGPTAADGIAMYVDGVSVPLNRETSPTYVAMENLAAPLIIGRGGPSWEQYDGGLDELRLWNVARTLSEIQTTMVTELGGAEPGLVGYWQFNDGTGTSAGASSPGTPSATLINGPVWILR
jgi:hypothetical protein